MLELVEYRNAMVRQAGQLSKTRRSQFIRQMDILFDSATERPFRPRLLNLFNIRAVGTRARAVIGAPLAVCLGLVFYLLWFSGPATVSASEFLARAVAADTNAEGSPGQRVIYQKLRIRSEGRSFERTVIHGSAGLRVLKDSKRDPKEADLASALALAGVDWDEPLSAVSYKSWHDRQANVTDEIRTSGAGQLTIVSNTAGGNIERESLTVQAIGFHPVERTIEFRDERIVDIAEVSLEASKTDFRAEAQPEGTDISAAIPVRAPLPSGAQLDETELLARQYLSRLNADTGEQIEFKRDSRSVYVKALVDSDRRKHELSEALRGIPFLAVGINSVSDFNATVKPVSEDNPAQQQTQTPRISLLEQYLTQHGHPRDELTRISAGLFNCSLAIHQASRNIEELQLRFSRDQEMTSAAVEARNALLTRNIQRLVENLTEQQLLLDESGIQVQPEMDLSESQGGRPESIVRLAERNAAATKEMISGANQEPRPIERVAQELRETIVKLRAAAVECHSQPPVAN